MAEVYILLAEGFEEIEALCPADLLRRGGMQVKLVAVQDELLVKGARQISVKADILLSEIQHAPDLLVLPGGMPGAKHLDESQPVHALIEKTVSAGALVGAICAAPMVLGRAGYLSGRKAVCYPGFEKDLAGAVIAKEKVVRDGQFITACGMGAALAFSAELLSALAGPQAARQVLEQVLA